MKKKFKKISDFFDKEFEANDSQKIKIFNKKLMSMQITIDDRFAVEKSASGYQVFTSTATSRRVLVKKLNIEEYEAIIYEFIGGDIYEVDRVRGDRDTMTAVIEENLIF